MHNTGVLMMHIKKPPSRSCLALLLAAALTAGSFSMVSAEDISSWEITEPEAGVSSNTDTTLDNDTESSGLLSDPSDQVPADFDNTEDDSSSDITNTSGEAVSSDRNTNNTTTSDDSEATDSFSSGDTGSVTSSISSGDNTDEEPDYILGRPMTQAEYEAQLAPMQNLTAFAPEDDIYSATDDTAAAGAYMGRSTGYPATYDSRTQNLVTSVKNQLNTNNCWAFSLASNIETDLLWQNLGSWDLSEEHLAYFWANRQNDPLGNTADDQIIRTPSSSNNKGYHESGNGWVASFFLSTWSGMTTEEKVPFSTTQQTYDSSLAYDTSVYMKDAVFANYSVDRMKELLTEYHSVSAMIYMDGSGTFYNASTAASCYPFANLVNHAVTIVGWDDTYSKDNFAESSCVTDDGAWIVKNSYGPSWGDNGYFYLSYEDLSIRNLLCNTATTDPEYPNNYFYDGAATASFTQPLKKGYTIGNIFSAKAGGARNEELGEIVLASKNDGAEYQIQVYTDIKDTSDPTSGTAAYSVPLSYTQQHAGIETVTLDTPILIRSGSRYSVVLTIESSSISYYLEKSTTKSSWFRAVAGISPEQSFISVGSGWNDMKTVNNSCFSIKAHTKTVDTPMPTPTPTPSPGSETDVIIDPEPVTYRITYNNNTTQKTTNMPSSQKAVSGSSVTVQKAPVLRSRFFYGWNTKADGTGTSYSPGQKIRLRKNTTLYAQWRTTYTSSDKLRYKVNGKYTVTCTGTTVTNIKSVNIPATVKYRGITYKITAVSGKAFRNRYQLASLSLGKNITTIGASAFDQCKKLKNITLSTGITKIGSNAFRNIRKGCIVRIPKKKYTTYRKLLQKYLSRMTIKRY